MEAQGIEILNLVTYTIFLHLWTKACLIINVLESSKKKHFKCSKQMADVHPDICKCNY